MRHTAQTFWMDDGGFLISAELVLVATILVLGVVVGLVQLQGSLIAELNDVACAIGALNQSYAIAGTRTFKGGHNIFTSGSFFKDTWDDCDCNFLGSFFCTGPVCGEGGFCGIAGWGGGVGTGWGGGGMVGGTCGGYLAPATPDTCAVLSAPATAAPDAICSPNVCSPNVAYPPGSVTPPMIVPQGAAPNPMNLPGPYLPPTTTPPK